MRLSHTFTFVLVGMVACGGFGSDDPAPNGNGSSSGSPGGSGPPGTPEQNAQPPGVNGAPLEGIFVSASRGADTNDGTMAKPLKTIAAGVKAGKEAKKRVLVCAEEYPEAVTLLDGVSMYGYVDCGGPEWKVDDTKRAKVKSPTSPAMKAESISATTRIEGFEVIAPDFGEGSATERDTFQTTSIALWVKASSNLSFGKDTFKAGKGRDGVDGADPAPLTRNDTQLPVAGASEMTFNNTSICGGVQCHGALNTYALSGGGAGGTASCTGAPGIPNPGPGGQGGAGGHWDGTGADNDTNNGAKKNPEAGLPASATPATAQGAPVFAPIAQGRLAGVQGADGSAGASGADGANGVILLGPDGVVPGDGSVGGNGTGGQGGGGGSGLGWRHAGNDHTLGASAGGGGAGGCPGLAGSAGLGGGASVGVYLVTSVVSFERTTVVSGKGGRGGTGALGSLETSGQSGASGGQPVGASGCINAGGATVPCDGYRGGNGGPGGRAGVSGHGAPGPSYGVVHFGDAPKTDAETTITPGEGGDGAFELVRGTAKIPTMPKGASEKIFKGQ